MSILPKMNFLVIEDDFVDVKILERGLKKLGATSKLVHKASCDEALIFFRDVEAREAIPRPFVVLLDINLPGTNGIEFLEQLRKIPGAENHYVIVFTTSKFQSDIDQAYAAGANAYVLKPTFSDELKRTLSTLLNYFDIVQLPSVAN